MNRWALVGGGMLATVLSLAAQGPADEPELMHDVSSGLRPLKPDPLVLPQWTPENEERRLFGDPLPLGGGLWPLQTDAMPAVSTSRRAPLPAGSDAAAGELAHTVASSYVVASFRALADPQQLLPEPVRLSAEKFLRVQARDGQWPLKIWLLRPGQAFPAGFSDEMLHRGAFGDDPRGVLALVAAGQEPRLVFPPPLAARLPTGEIGTITRRVATAAATPASDVEKIKRAVLELGFALHDFRPADAPSPALASGEPSAAESAASAPASAPAAAEPTAWLLPTAIAALMAAAFWWIRRLKRADEPVLLPEVTFSTRLGAPHSGGGGSTMEWGRGGM